MQVRPRWDTLNRLKTSSDSVISRTTVFATRSKKLLEAGLTTSSMKLLGAPQQDNCFWSPVLGVLSTRAQELGLQLDSSVLLADARLLREWAFRGYRGQALFSLWRCVRGVRFSSRKTSSWC